MIPSFNQQSSKNIGVLEDTLLRLVQSLPKGTLAKYGYSCADAAVKNLNIRKVPGLVALPNIKRSDYEKDVLQLVPDNVLFEENLCSSAALYQVIQEKIGKARENHGLTWPKEIQDKIIAGLFGMTYLETALFPIKSIQEVTEALFVLTEEQANVVADQNVPRRWITGPAGTGKTWMLLLSLRKTYHSFMAQKRGKRKILTITFNSALRDYIEDTAKKLLAGVELSSKVECKIDVFTVESLKKHLKRKMIGKTNSLLNLNSTSLDEDMDFSEVFSTYHDSVTSETFHSFENFGYDAIFVDEAQDIPSTDEDWIRKLWKDGRRNDLRKLWIFGDEGQNMTGFLGNNQSLLSQKLATDPDAIQNLNKQCRTTLDIYERYHKIRYEHDAAYNGNDNGAGTDKEEYENDDGSSDGGESSDNEIDRSSVRVHCNKCNVSTFNIRGQKVEEKNVGLNYVPTEIVSKLEVLVRTELIAVEDIAVLCASHLEVEDLEKELPALLTVKPGGLFKKGNLQIVKAEDFATKCTKLHKSRKRKLAGEAPSQKKYLMVDTVRRFKGLEAQVKILILFPFEPYPVSGCHPCEQFEAVRKGWGGHSLRRDVAGN